MTLVEVVAGIALLATLLVSILSAHRAHAAQIRAAQDRLAAIGVADRLLAQWISEGILPAVGDREIIPETSGWSWRMVRSEPSEEIRQLGARAVRLEIVRAADSAPAQVLTSVEVLVQGGARTTQ